MGDAQSHDAKLLYAKLFQQVRGVLMRDWDPIGIAEMDGAPDNEYDRYARTLCGALFNPGLSEEPIRDYLTQVAEKWIGLPADRDAVERTARAIVGLRKGFFGEN
jgi:hypothetical protein